MEFGIVGLGHIAEKAYLKAAGMQSAASLVAVCDTDAGKARRWSESLEVNPYLSADEMMREEDLDFVVVLTPHNTHLPILKTAAKHRVDVLKEKPLALSMVEALEMQRIAKKADIKVTVALQRRFSELHRRYETMKDGVENPFLVEIRYTRSISRPDEGWRGERRLAGGGCTIDMGYHMIDLLLWYFGLPTEVHMASSARAVPGIKYDAEDTSLIQFRYGSGLYGSLLLSRAYAPDSESVRLTGSSGYCELGRDDIIQQKHGVQKRVHAEYDMTALVARELECFAKSLDGKGEVSSSIEDNLMHMDFINACYSSEKEGRVVSLPKRWAKVRTTKGYEHARVR